MVEHTHTFNSKGVAGGNMHRGLAGKRRGREWRGREEGSGKMGGGGGVEKRRVVAFRALHWPHEAAEASNARPTGL